MKKNTKLWLFSYRVLLSQGPGLTPFKWDLLTQIVSPVPVNLFMEHDPWGSAHSRGMKENGLSEPKMCNSHWQRLSSEDTDHSDSGQFCFPKASSKFQNSIKCSIGQLCNTIGRSVQPQPPHLLQADGLTCPFVCHSCDGIFRFPKAV